jgi:hypothetical protein
MEGSLLLNKSINIANNANVMRVYFNLSIKIGNP